MLNYGDMVVDSDARQVTDVEQLVVEMIKKGAYEVTRPEHLGQGDFDQLQDFIARVNTGFYQECALRIMWEKSEHSKDRESMMGLLKRRDYEAAYRHLVYISDFIPA